MTTTIPDLWSEDIKVDVLTPLVILRAQENLLSRKTQGTLNAKVTTVSSEDWVEHQLDLIAPAWHQYRTTVLTARHARNRVYPVVVKAQCFVPKRNGLVSPEPIRPPGSLPPDQREAATQDEFIDLVRQVLRSADVRATIQSLIAQSNESNGSENGADGE